MMKGDTLYTVDAKYYDLDPRQPDWEVPFYVDFCKDLDGDILDLGCGTGRFTIPLAQAGHNVHALEYSSQMLEQLHQKLKALPEETSNRITLVHGDMSNFKLDQKFSLIMIPGRSYHLLLDDEKEIFCLEHVYEHLADNGSFILEIGDFLPFEAMDWGSEEESFDWQNVDPETGNTVTRHRIFKSIDRHNRILYPQKVYRVGKPDGTVEKIVKQVSLKYFYREVIEKRLLDNGFRITRRMGEYNGTPIGEGHCFIYICQKD